MLDPLLLKILSIGFGLMFLLAAVHKFSGLQRFRATLAAYEIMPAGMAAVLGVLLPIAEGLLGAAWLLVYQPAALGLVTVALLASYTTGIAVNLRRGRVHIDCGCSMGRQAGGEQQLSWGLVGRNVFLILAALLATLPAGARTIGPVDYLTLIAGLLAILFLYGAANQLLSNGAAIGAWRRSHGAHGHD